MKIITDLNGTAKEGDWNETRGVVQTVLNRPTPRTYRHITLGQGGVIVSMPGIAKIGIPMDEILKLAEKYEPLLIPKEPEKKAAPAQTNPK